MLRKAISILSLMVALMLTINGCTSITVRPIEAHAGMKHVCIENNPKVIIDNFVSVVQSGFERHGITTSVYHGPIPAECEYVLSYTALRSWDFAPYLSHAELNLRKGNNSIASAEYHLRGKGGLSLLKWRGVKRKMDPVIDQLLMNFK